MGRKKGKGKKGLKKSIPIVRFMKEIIHIQKVFVPHPLDFSFGVALRRVVHILFAQFVNIGRFIKHSMSPHQQGIFDEISIAFKAGGG